MKIGIISDTHGCHERWSLAYDKYFKDADMIIHAVRAIRCLTITIRRN